MTFLNPSLLLFLLPLAALPLVIHILNKKFPNLFHFPSVENIKEAMARRSQLHRWRHLILLLLRTAFLILLLLAFLKPVHERLGSHAGGKKERHVLIVFDHSLSMEHKGDGPSSRQRALHEAEKLLDSLTSEDWVNVVLIEQSPSARFVDFTRDHGEVRNYLRSLKPGLTRGDVNQANNIAAPLLSKVKEAAEIHYFSDFQRKNWANADFGALPPNARLFFVDVSPKKKDNHAILDARIAQSQILAGDTVVLEVTVGNFGENPLNSRLTVMVDKRLSFDQDAFVAPWSVGKVTVPVPVGAPGLHLCDISLPPDNLEQDDHFCVTLSALEKEEVLIVSDGAGGKQEAAYYLKTALNPAEDLSGSLLPKTITSSELSAARLAGVRKMFLTHPGPLNDTAAALLAKYVFNGGGLIYFLDGKADAENLARLEKATATSMPVRLSARREAKNVAAGAQQIVRGDFKSRFLKLFRGATRQDLALLEFYDYYQCSATGSGDILLVYADESPAMASLSYGMGTLLLLNFSADELSGNLPRQRIFPAWIQELTKALTADEPPPSAYVVGETLHTEVWRNELRDAEFKSPAGQAVAVKREPQGERYNIAFTPDQFGFYTLGANKPLYAFGVNASADEADLRPVDKDLLPAQLKGNQQGHFIAGGDDFEELAHGQPLYHWFVLAAVAFLVCEAAFQLLLRKAVP